MERDRQECTLRGHSDWVRSVAFSPDGTRVVSGSDDKLVKIWRSDTGAEVCTPRVCTRWCDEFQAFWRLFGDVCTRVLALIWSELSAMGRSAP